MMRSSLFVAGLVSLLALPFSSDAGRQGAANVSGKGAKTVTPAELKKVVEGNNRFAFDLYRQLAKKKGNIFFSPYSISTALAMAYAGASGDAAKEMAKTLYFSLPPEELHPAYGKLIQSIEKRRQSERFQLKIANGLWLQQGLAVRPEFLQLTGAHYGARPQLVDFAGDPENARQRVNRWVEEKTNGRIREALGYLSNHTRFVLANAVYFKGGWQRPFDASLTKEKTFWLPAGETIRWPHMHKVATTQFYDAGDFSVLRLWYENCSMYLLLPASKDGLAKLEQSLSFDEWNKCLQRMKPHQVEMAIPKFKVSAEYSLSGELSKLGLRRVFSDGKAFEGLTSDGNLTIGQFLHKSFVAVNEKESEAAAATIITGVHPVRDGPSSPPPPRAVFHADHPFLFLIREHLTGTTLFLGRFMDPRKS